MTEQERKARTKRRQELKRKRQYRVRLIRTCLIIGLLVVCAGTGVLASRGKANRKAKPEPVLAAGAIEAVAAVDPERETAAFVQRRQEIPEVRAIYGIHVYDKGWSNYFAEGAYCMAPAGGYVTAMRATLQNQPEDMSGTIGYQVNLSGSGWLDWTEDAGEGGSISGEMPLEAVRIHLTGELSEYYDVLYSVLQDNTWTDWVKNGEDAGASGAGLRVDGIRISIAKKEEGKTSYAGDIDPSKPMIALTYDDGPSSTQTPRILAALKAHGARATFFMVGNQAAKNMGIVKQMTEQGSEVANHTYDHKLMSKVSQSEMTRQLELTNQTVADASGISPVLMRPCGGERNESGMCAVGAISMPAVMWSIDTRDWKTRDAQKTIDAVLGQVQDGDIILMHDLYEATAEASETLIPELISQGYQLVTVSELASYRGGMIPGESYSRFRPVS